MTSGARPGSARPEPQRPPQGPDPLGLARAVAVTWLEVRSGLRPLHQLAPVLSPTVAHRVAAELQRDRRTGAVNWAPGNGAVLACLAQRSSEHACDAVVVVRTGPRISAVVVRTERHRGAWRIVELARPEDGYEATRTASVPEVAPDVLEEPSVRSSLTA